MGGVLSAELVQALQFCLGVGLLVGGAYLLVEGGSRVAAILGVPPVVVGLTVVAFGTSAPEFFVSVIGAINGSTDLVLGNVIGSNVANLGLILALAAILRPVKVESKLPLKEIPLLVVVTLVFSFMAMDQELAFWDGVILTACFAGFMFWTFRSGSRGEPLAVVETAKVEVDPAHRSREAMKGSLQVLAGMGGLAGGGQLIVTAATGLALSLGISEAVVGLTLVAVGTSLPELATTIMAAWKNQDDMALGNIIGSNLFNILGVAGPISLFGLKATGSILPQLGAMLALTVVMALMIMVRRHSVGRYQGWFLLALYGGSIALWLN